MRKGFTLVETLIAIFIFSLIMTMISGIFADFMKNYFVQRENQKNVENAIYILSLMEKTIRTSVVYTKSSATVNNINTDGTVVPVLDFKVNDGNRLMLYDNSQLKCIVYHFDSVLKKIEVASAAGDSIADCGDFSSINAYTPLTARDIENVWVQGWASGAGAAGRITVTIAVKEIGQVNPLTASMTASLRDF